MKSLTAGKAPLARKGERALYSPSHLTVKEWISWRRADQPEAEVLEILQQDELEVLD